jgi:murein DD-endopeptidase MepM/ murein hydrolase activator NlpD
VPPPTAAASPQAPAVARNNDPRRGEFSPPPEQVPLSLDPRDHFWLRRPVDSSANSTALFLYAYGSDGPNNEWRVHHGIDLPNPIGKEVRAAADGRVIWAADNYSWHESRRYAESAYSYGNVVIIEHNFGFQGKRLYTLYAHLQLILVSVGQNVRTGEVIGLSGRSGVVSGPHVHFEVRVGRNSYYETRNPLLWIAPYENHGVVAGRVTLPDGSLAQDVNVVLMKGERKIDATTTYVNPRQPNSRTWNVNSDEVWRENFVIGDVPVGTYQVLVFLNGRRLVRDVTVRPATTSFVDFTELEVVPLPTPSPTPAG